MKIERGALRDVPVKFGTFSGSDERAAGRLGVMIARQAFDPACDEEPVQYIEAVACGVQCRVALRYGESGLVDNSVAIDGVCEVQRFGVSRDAFTFSLEFDTDVTDINALFKCANREGTLTIERLGDAPKRKPGRPAKEDDDD